MNGLRMWLVAGSVVAGLLGSASAGVDVETGGSLKAKGAIAPSGEIEDFTFTAVEGTLLTVSLKADPKSGMDPSLSLLNLDTEDEVALEPPALVDSGSSLSLRSLPIPYSGRWTLRVSGEGSGAYSLSIKTKAPKSAAGSLEVAPAGEGVFTFAAPEGAALSIVAKSARGSAAVPRLGGLAVGGADDVDLQGVGKITPTSQAVRLVTTGTGGDHSLYLTSDGTATGTVDVKVKIKAPRAKKENLDLRGEALGNPGGGETFVSRLIGSSGGTVEAGNGGLEGAVLEIPGGALPGNVTITMASAAAPQTPSGNDQAAGPAVDLRPSGLTFDAPALLTLPFDFAKVPADRSVEDIRVLVVEGNGTTFEITPTSVNVSGGTVTLPVGGFSICIPIIEQGLPRLGVAPGGDEFWVLTLEYDLERDPEGNDSRARYFLQEVGEASLFGDGTLQISSSWRTFSFTNASTGGGIDSGLQVFESGQDYEAEWEYGEDGRTIVVREGDGGAVLATSRDGSVLVEMGEEAEEGTSFSLAVRKMAVPFTTETLKGAWTAGGVELAVNGGGGGAASMQVQRILGTLTFDGKGKVGFTDTARKATVDSGTGNLLFSTENEKGTADYSVEGDGTILITMPPHDGDDEGDVLRIFPGRDGDVMFLTDDGPCGSCTYAMILIRQGSGLSTAALDGTWIGSNFSVDLQSYAPADESPSPDSFVGDPSLMVLDFTILFDGDATASLDGIHHEVRREEGAAGGVFSELSPFATDLGVAVDGKGVLTLSPTGQPGLVKGAISPDGMFGFLVTNPALADGDFTMGFMVKAPPGN